ncbi:MAG: pyrroloquinoline quinone biosynthesis peptide chaperone PqqD [Pseudomonadota bacterium]
MTAGVRLGHPVITAQSVPILPRHVVLRHDKVRERWLVLVPERVLVPEDTAVAVLQLVDGQRSVAEIAAELAATYTAPVDLILTDSIVMLQDLADKGFLATVSERAND